MKTTRWPVGLLTFTLKVWALSAPTELKEAACVKCNIQNSTCQSHIGWRNIVAKCAQSTKSTNNETEKQKNREREY